MPVPCHNPYHANFHAGKGFVGLFVFMNVLIEIGILSFATKETSQVCKVSKSNVAFIVFGLMPDGFQTFSKNWDNAIGMNAKVDIFYSPPLMNSRGDKITDEDVEALRTHLLSLNGTVDVYIESSGADFTNISAALVQQSGEPAFLDDTKYVTHRIWSLFLSTASSISYATRNLCFSSKLYEFIVVGRLEALGATNIVGPRCIDVLNRNALPLLRPSPLEYMIEDRIMVLPSCLLSSFGDAMSNPARLFLDSNSELQIANPRDRSIEFFIQNALTLAVRTGACSHILEAIYEPTCVENIWSIPVNGNKYSEADISRSMNLFYFVRDQLSFENPNFKELFGPNGFYIFKTLSDFVSDRAMRLYNDRLKCVKEREAEFSLSEEMMDFPKGVEVSLSGPYKPQLRSVAILVPVHPPKFSWASKLIEDHLEAEFLWDLIFVFSSTSDAVLFESLLNHDLRETYIPLIMPIIDITPGIVTIKKWWGLTIIHSCYEFVVCIDAETTITDPKLFANAVRKSAAVGNVYQASLGSVPMISVPTNFTGLTSDRGACFSVSGPNSVYKPGEFHEIVINSIALLPLYLQETSARATKDCSLYSWFSDIPIYPTVSVRQFFFDVKWPHNLPVNYKYDHFLFQLWKIARNEWQSVDLTVDAGWPLVDHISYLFQLPELQNNPSMWMNIRNRYFPGPLWRPMRLCKADKEACSSRNGVFAIFHLDRDIP